MGDVGALLDVDDEGKVCVGAGIDLCFMPNDGSVGVVSSASRCCKMTEFGIWILDVG